MDAKKIRPSIGLPDLFVSKYRSYKVLTQHFITYYSRLSHTLFYTSPPVNSILHHPSFSQLLLLKVFLKEKDLIIDGVIPIVPIVCTGTKNEIVTDLFID